MSSASRSRPKSESASSREEEDWYAVLDVDYAASQRDIKRAYRSAIKRIHPDRARPEDREIAEQQTRLVNHAYRVLTDPESRRAHDAELKANVIQDQIMSHYFGGMGMPGGEDITSQRIRAAQTLQARREQQQHDRRAAFSLLIAFTAILIVVLLGLLTWSVVDSIANVAFE